MIDWNNNGKIDPEEVFLTQQILAEEEEEEEEKEEEELLTSENSTKSPGCLFTLLTLPILLIVKGLHQ